LAVGVARADRIEPYLEALRGRGIEVRRAVSEPDALGSLCRYVYRMDSCLFLEPSQDGYEGGLLENGVLSLTFSGRFQSRDPRERAGRLEREIGELLERHVPGQAPPWVVAGRFDGDAARTLAEQMNRPVRILQPSDFRERIHDAPEGISMAALGGILATMAPGTRGMNLLARGVHAEGKSPRVLTAVLAAALAAAGLFLLVSPLQLEERRIEEINRQIELYKDDVRKADAVKREVDGLEDEIASIYRFKEQRPVALEILRELTAVIPKNTWLSRVRITDNTVDIEGYASAATDILPLLEASPHFKKVEFASPTLRDVRLNAERFTIRMEQEGIKSGGLEPDKKQ
jgi:general secretion pathway protein L